MIEEVIKICEMSGFTTRASLLGRGFSSQAIARARNLKILEDYHAGTFKFASPHYRAQKVSQLKEDLAAGDKAFRVKDGELENTVVVSDDEDDLNVVKPEEGEVVGSEDPSRVAPEEDVENSDILKESGPQSRTLNLDLVPYEFYRSDNGWWSCDDFTAFNLEVPEHYQNRVDTPCCLKVSGVYLNVEQSGDELLIKVDGSHTVDEEIGLIEEMFSAYYDAFQEIGWEALNPEPQ